MTVRICAKCSAYFLTAIPNRRYCSERCRRACAWLRHKRAQSPVAYARHRRQVKAWQAARKRAVA